MYRPSGWEGGGIRLFAKKGEICNESVTLGRRKIPLGSVVETRAHGKELLLAVATPYGRDDVQITIAPGRFHGAWNLSGESRARRVKEAIDRPLSRFRLEQHRRRLGAEDGQVEVRSEVCPHCLSLVDLTGLPPSRQVFCPYCQTLGTLGPTPRPEERSFTICPQCHYFACPVPFTSIRAANLFLVLLWERETMVGCGACMRAEAWVNLRGNVLSLIGVPASALEFAQARFRDSRRFVRYAELDEANGAAADGRSERADVLYERILGRNDVSAGVRYNQAKWRYDQEDWSAALAKALSALGDCPNYPPAADLACRSLVRLGRLEDAETLRARTTGAITENTPDIGP
jgi:hypothetical protein